MPTLFRKVRRALINEGHLKKYLLYAIGEILLVVIGILIALRINNWNQLENNRTAELNSYQNLKRQLLEDHDEIAGNVNYNLKYLDQFQYASPIIEADDKSKLDTLGKIILNLTRYSDFHRQGNIYENIVNSGEIKILKNKRILDRLQRLEETYIYINKLENIHAESITTYMIPQITSSIKVNTLEIKRPEQIFTFEFQNNFSLLAVLMLEKDEIYNDALKEIKSIIQLIDQEKAGS